MLSPTWFLYRCFWTRPCLGKKLARYACLFLREACPATLISIYSYRKGRFGLTKAYLFLQPLQIDCCPVPTIPWRFSIFPTTIIIIFDPACLHNWEEGWPAKDLSTFGRSSRRSASRAETLPSTNCQTLSVPEVQAPSYMGAKFLSLWTGWISFSLTCSRAFLLRIGFSRAGIFWVPTGLMIGLKMRFI